MFFRSSKWADSTWGYVLGAVIAISGLYAALKGDGSSFLPRPVGVILFGFMLGGALLLLVTDARDRKRRRTPRRRTEDPRS